MQQPPSAPRQPFTHTEHGVQRPDPYHWMRRVDSPALLDHLAAERRWYDTATAHLGPLVETIRAEMASRLPPADSSVSWELLESVYYTRFVSGRDYAQLVRESRRSIGAPESETVASGSSDDGSGGAGPGVGGSSGTVLLDENALVGDSGYLDVGYLAVSPDERLLAYCVDLVGDEVYQLRFRDLTTGEDLTETVPRCYYGGAWSADSRTFFYTVHDEAYRPHQVWRHAVGTPATEDVLVLEETDERFPLGLRGTRSGDLVVIWAASRDTSEVWVVDAHRPSEPARSVGGRRRGVEYHAEHLRDGDRLLLVTNDGAPEFRLATAPVPRGADQSHAAWRPLRKEDPSERLERADAFAGHVVLTLRTDGRRVLRMLPVSDLAGPGVDVPPAFEAGSVELGPNERYDATRITVRDTSYVHPPVWTEVDLTSGKRTERHRAQAPGHDPDRYACERRWAVAPDGTRVPMTLVRHRDTPLDGTAPALLYGYGAYEAVDEPAWDPALPSLLDRGVVFVHAHVRGGGEGGRRWYLQGRLEHKQNTFTDHLAVADSLEGVVDGNRIATRGLSAGGLLQAAVLGMRPDRWRAVVAEVPFVDVVSTMLDPSIPLTVNEWDEWGDPRDRTAFDWMLAYSPYDNVPAAGGRPDLLVTGALHDARVMVWEPAKWVAALRETDPEWSPRCLFRCELGAGSHVGPSGRYGHLAYEAEVYAWVLDRLGVRSGVGGMP